MREPLYFFNSLLGYSWRGMDETCGPSRLMTSLPENRPITPSPTKMITRHTVDADGHPIAVWEKSPSGARGAIVLLHGRTWSALPNFDLQVPGEELSLMDGLAEAGYAAFAVDLRGYGQTPRDETGWVTPGRSAKDLKATLEHVQLLIGSAPPPRAPRLVPRLEGGSTHGTTLAGVGVFLGLFRLLADVRGGPAGR